MIDVHVAYCTCPADDLDEHCPEHGAPVSEPGEYVVGTNQLLSDVILSERAWVAWYAEQAYLVPDEHGDGQYLRFLKERGLVGSDPPIYRRLTRTRSWRP